MTVQCLEVGTRRSIAYDGMHDAHFLVLESRRLIILTRAIAKRLVPVSVISAFEEFYRVHCRDAALRGQHQPMWYP